MQPSGQQADRQPRRSSVFTRIVAGGLVGVLGFLALEGLCRLYFATLIGRSILFYGSPLERAAITEEEHSPLLGGLRSRRMRGIDDRNHSVRHTDNERAGYSKYHPHQSRTTYDADTGEVYPVTINARGFRGRDFTDEKPEGVIRVVTLGASSTFGYHDRDDLTYPAQLERLLNSSCPQSFEVINLGIPHLTSTQILALFAAEGLALKPDIVTFYEGLNDAGEMADEREPEPQVERVSRRGWSKPASRWLRARFLVVALGDAIVSSWKDRYSPEQIETQIEASRRAFLNNLDRLLELSRAEGFVAVIATQQSRSMLIPREEIRGVSFQQELDLVADQLAAQGWVGRKQAAFLAHAALLAAQREWAQRRDAIFVDVHQALDARRDTIVSWVHLSHEGNRLIAEQLAAAILDRTCPDHSFGGAFAARSSTSGR